MFTVRKVNDKTWSALTAAGLCALLLASLWLYWPGLSGIFLLDHERWIGAIGNHGGVVDWETLKLYLFEEPFSLHNRYLGRLTFLIDDQYWPSSPFNFKRTSLLLHLLNGTLLFALCLQIAPILDLPKHRGWGFALIASAIWILHPINHSTVLYAAQRMTIVAAFFILLALVTYLAGRKRINDTPRLGAFLIVLSLYFLTTLGVLSKEIAIFIPLYVILLELTLLRQHKRSILWFWLASIGIGLPVILGLIYGLTRWENLFINSYLLRDYTAAERLLTQGRVVADYLHLIFVPSLEGLGLFHDDFPISRGWLEPASTLLAWIFHLLLISSALVWHRRIPLISFAILFFYIGHLLESTAIGLEIYFEHRNYVPLVGISIAVAYYLMRPWKTLKPLGPFTAVTLMVTLAFMTRINSSVWGDTQTQTIMALIDHPNSPRAQQHWLGSLVASNQLTQADAVSDRLIELTPNLISPYLQKATVQCLLGENIQSQVDQILMIAASSGRDAATARNIKNLMIVSDSSDCMDSHPSFWVKVGERLLLSQHFIADRRSSQNAINMITNYLSSKGRTTESAELMEKALLKFPDQKLAIAMTRIYVYLNDEERARRALETAKNLRPSFTATTVKTDKMIKHLEAKIEQLN